jgi:Cytochrome C oxidase, cbb3-type, subunit III
MKKSLIFSLSVGLLGAASILTFSAVGANSVAKNPTFNKDVAPIFNAKCAECHRPGEAAPFSTLSYKDARPWAKSIREKVISKEMPPWHADAHFGAWKNDRRLSEAEIKTIVAWIDGGAVEGNPKDLPAAPKFIEGWNISKPDVVIEMPEEYTLDANGPDEYQYFDMPTNFTEDKYIQMVEARPGNRKVVHHILAFIVPAGSPSLSKVKKEMRDKAIEMSLKGSPWYRDGQLIRTKDDTPIFDNSADVPNELRGYNGVDGYLTAYAPGHNPDIWQPGIAKKVPAGSTIRFQVHYSKVAGSVQKDRSMIGMVFAKSAPEKLLTTQSVANMFFKIPAGANHHPVKSEWVLWRDSTVYSFSPHMHYRGAAMEYRAIYPDGKTEVLLNVPNYSFAWQTSYFLKEPKRFPKGTKLQVTAHFDNSAKNKANPDPSKDVRYGEPTYDEMMIGFLDSTYEWPAAVKIDPAVLSDYVGRYEVGNGTTIQIVKEQDKIVSIGTDKLKYELIPIGKDKFRMPEQEAEITFVRNAQGEVIERIRASQWGEARYKKVKESASK